MSKLVRNFSNQSFTKQSSLELVQLAPSEKVKSEFDRNNYIEGFSPFRGQHPERKAKLSNKHDSFEISLKKPKK